MLNPTDKLIESIKKKALACIAQYGDLRWCNAKICACMGCANHKMSKEEYELALTIPEVNETIRKRREATGKFTFPAGYFAGRLNESDLSK
ncbi:hypothetical protein JC221_082 [Yersinia phage JC221]|nr:hypothetical protein JC221_082 [Yersinia phage JC221]